MPKLIFFCCLIFCYSCKKTATNDSSENILHVNKNTGKVFESFRFYIFDLSKIKNTYDSIICFSTNQDSSIVLLNKYSKISSFQTCFYYPGTYQIYIEVFNRNKMIHKDSVSINIIKESSKDFLHFYWSDSLTNYAEGALNVFSRECFYFLKNKDHNVNYINVYCLPRNNSEFRLYDFQKNELYKLMSSYYNDPMFSILGGNDILQYFNEKFKIKKDSPVYIWSNNTMTSALLSDQSECYIHAEKIN